MDSMIPAKLYKRIVESVPIVCVDVVLTFKGKFVLVKRSNEPLKGKWWVVGGRAYKGEKTKETAKRKIKEEVGMRFKYLKRIGIYEDSYPKSAWGVPTSSISIVYQAEVTSGEFELDDTSSELGLFDKLPDRFIKKYEAN